MSFFCNAVFHCSSKQFIKISQTLSVIPELCFRVQILKTHLILHQLCTAKFCPALHCLLHTVSEASNILQYLSEIRHCKFCSCRRRWGTKICHKICDRKISFVTYCRNNGRPALKNSSGNFFFIKCPEVFDRSTASSDNNHINLCLIQHMDSTYNTVCCSFSLYKCRIQNNLQIRITSQ